MNAVNQGVNAVNQGQVCTKDLYQDQLKTRVSVSFQIDSSVVCGLNPGFSVKLRDTYLCQNRTMYG